MLDKCEKQTESKSYAVMINRKKWSKRKVQHKRNKLDTSEKRSAIGRDYKIRSKTKIKRLKCSFA